MGDAELASLRTPPRRWGRQTRPNASTAVASENRFPRRPQEEPMTVTAATIRPWPLVRKGDRQHPVKTLQSLLRARGHNLVVDGIFGPKTDAAVRAFQQQQGLAVDGIVGPHTWSVLIITVKRGSQGDAVRGVQEEFEFRRLSGDPVQVDGIFGAKTDAAVRAFQRALHQDIPSVVVDGIV